MKNHYKMCCIINLISCLFFLIAIFNLPHSFYPIMRTAIFVMSGIFVFIYYSNVNEISLMFIPVVIIAILWNPIFSFTFDKNTWVILDIAALIVELAISLYMLYLSIKFNSFFKNSKRLLNICLDLIRNYEKEGVSCREAVEKQLILELNYSREEITNFKDFDTDYIKIAHGLLVDITYSFLSSGQYHLYCGMLNPMSCANNLMNVYRNSMAWAVKNNLITEEVREQEFEKLRKNIASMG